jgi:hypothetical protein
MLAVAFRPIRPTWRNYIEYVDFAARNGDPAMVRYRDSYLALAPRDRRNHWPEQICELANVTPGELVGAVCRALWECGAAESSIASAIAHPEVVERTVKLALKADHYRDRELFFRLTGSLPDKKGASINILNQPVAAVGAGGGKGDRPGAWLETMDEFVIETSRLLDSAPPCVFPVREEEDPNGTS